MEYIPPEVYQQVLDINSECSTTTTLDTWVQQLDAQNFCFTSRQLKKIFWKLSPLLITLQLDADSKQQKTANSYLPPSTDQDYH